MRVTVDTATSSLHIWAASVRNKKSMFIQECILINCKTQRLWRIHPWVQASYCPLCKVVFTCFKIINRHCWTLLSQNISRLFFSNLETQHDSHQHLMGRRSESRAVEFTSSIVGNPSSTLSLKDLNFLKPQFALDLKEWHQFILNHEFRQVIVLYSRFITLNPYNIAITP